MGIPRAQYLRQFDRTNVLHTFPGRHKRDDAFPLGKARVAAAAMIPLLGGREVVMVGRNVATVFGLELQDFHTWSEYGSMFGGKYDARFRVAVVPHTSGRNRWYNNPDNLSIARSFWRDYLAALSSAVT